VVPSTLPTCTPVWANEGVPGPDRVERDHVRVGGLLDDRSVGRGERAHGGPLHHHGGHAVAVEPVDGGVQGVRAGAAQRLALPHQQVAHVGQDRLVGGHGLLDGPELVAQVRVEADRDAVVGGDADDLVDGGPRTLAEGEGDPGEVDPAGRPDQGLVDVVGAEPGRRGAGAPVAEPERQ
jgi:hypothetical protein